MLVFPAQNSYKPPCTCIASDLFITNEVVQVGSTADENVYVLTELIDKVRMSPVFDDLVEDNICLIIANSFEDATGHSSANFQRMLKSFQLFGVEFILDRAEKIWLQEFGDGPFSKYRDNTADFLFDLLNAIVAIVMEHWFDPTPSPDNNMKTSVAKCCGMVKIGLVVVVVVYHVLLWYSCGFPCYPG